MKKITYLLLALIGLLVFFYVYDFYNSQQTSRIIINNKSFNIELAVSNEEKNLGLGYRDSLDENSAMLFLFDKPGNHGFWMRGMKFPLDIIYILNNRIVGVYENAPILSDKNSIPQIYGNELVSDMVLEINSGLAKKYNIKKGDEVKLHIKN